jgi:hydroxymethylpyrimidine/phosphomethylpyrimidine kinase
MKQVLTIAGSDSGGGAGIQADLKAIHANGAFGMSVVTSITAQNTVEVRTAYDLPVEVITDQIDAVFDDFDVAAVKTGMLSSSAIVEAVSARLQDRKVANLVVDPVMVSKSGYDLLKSEAVSSIRSSLLPLARLVTPNVHEARLLSGMDLVRTVEDAQEAASRILQAGPDAVLVKGGHLEGQPQAVDVLCQASGTTLFPADRIETQNTHGTGCTYSAAIAAQLASGKPLKEAVAAAKVYITEAIRYSLDIGNGHGPTNHFYFLDRGQ